MRIDLPDGASLSSLGPSDAPALQAVLSQESILKAIPVIPRPYTLDHARSWIAHRTKALARNGVEISFAIRAASGEFVGCVGVDDTDLATCDEGELGYWLSEHHRGRGLMQAAVAAFIPHAFKVLKLRQLNARTMSWNEPSLRVVREAGFEAVAGQDAAVRKEWVFRLLASTRTP